jgi:hypothetical protein
VSRVRPPLSLEGKGCTGSLSRLRWRSSDPTCLWLSSPGCCTRRRRAARGGARGASSAAESGTDRCIRQGGGGEAGPAGRLRRCGAFLTVGGGRSPRGMPCRASHQLEVPSISSLVRGEDTRDAVAAQVVPVAAGSPDSRAKEPEHPRTAGPPRPASTVGGRSTFVIRSPRDRAQGLIVRDSQAAAFWTPTACWWGRTMGSPLQCPGQVLLTVCLGEQTGVPPEIGDGGCSRDYLGRGVACSSPYARQIAVGPGGCCRNCRVCAGLGSCGAAVSRSLDTACATGRFAGCDTERCL